MMARIREAENTQCVAELTQRISNLEYKNQELVAEGDLTTSISESDRMRELQDKVACLRAQVIGPHGGGGGRHLESAGGGFA